MICFGAKREETSWLDAKRFDKWRPWYAPVTSSLAGYILIKETSYVYSCYISETLGNIYKL